MSAKSFLEKAQALDRRWIFLFIALAVIVPFAFKLEFREPATPLVESIFDHIEGLPENSRVLLSFDFDPPSEPELLPMATSVARHLAMRGHRLYFMTLWPVGQQEVANVVRVLREEYPEMIYGEDWVEWGYRVGGQGVIQNLLADISRSYETDTQNTALTEIPMMEGVRSLRDMDMIISVSAGDPGIKQWIQFAGDPGQIPVAAAVTAVSAPQLFPYYPAQMLGMMGGLKAAAEYESLLMENFPEKYPSTEQFAAIPRMGPQTVAHIVILLFILIGNIAFFATRGRGAATRLKSLQ